MSDIVGEKRLYEAAASLLQQLSMETNYYTATSIISAIGKLNIESGAVAIMKWAQANERDIINTNHLFVLKHCRIALSRLDDHHGTNYTHEFDLKYREMLKNYFIL